VNLPRKQYADSKNLSARMDLHARFSTNPQGWMNWLFEKLDLKEAYQVLELGCGPGGLWQDRIKTLPANLRLVMTDASPGMVSEAGARLQDERISFQVVDAQSIPFPDRTFDAVIASHMLYHVPNIPHALSEIRRVLKPSGKLFAATNGRAHLRELDDMIRSVVPDFPAISSSFTLENGESLIQGHFEDIMLLRYEDSLVVPDVSALSSYVGSMASLVRTTEEQLRAIDGVIEHEMNRNSPISISKDSGVFVASHPIKANQERE
jgi:ubiquinone/menaquinone biosynthesis C-methylase UbiE